MFVENDYTSIDFLALLKKKVIKNEFTNANCIKCYPEDSKVKTGATIFKSMNFPSDFLLF